MKDKRKNRESELPAGRRGKLRWSHFLFFAAGALLAAEAMIVIQHQRLPSDRKIAHAGAVLEAVPNAPWGVLEQVPLALDRPDEYLLHDDPAREIEWFFGNRTAAELTSVFGAAGLSESQRAALLDSKRWKIGSNGMVVRPPLAVVHDMTETARRNLYGVLAQTAENVQQRFPFTFRGNIEDWLGDAGLSEQQMRDLAQMVYRRGEVLLFSDLRYFQLTAPPAQVPTLLRRLTRVSTLFLQLHVDEQSDIPRLVQYWGHNEDAKLLLESLARVPGGSSIHIEHFLPPVPRALLYTYPHPKQAGAAKINCVWSSMNFFNADADNRFFDESFTAQALDSQYHRVPKADALGDIIMLYKAESSGPDQMIHMCVFVADDVVFTKNGGDIYQPWVLMRLPDVRALFANETDLKTAIYRRNAGS